MNIKIPNLNNYNSIKFCKTIKELPKDWEYILDFRNVYSFSPLGMLLCRASVKNLKNKNLLKKIKMQYVDSENISYAAHMAFFTSMSFNLGKKPGEAIGNSNYIPITKIEFRELNKQAINNKTNITLIIEKESSRLARILARDNDELFRFLSYTIKEILRNSQEHSKSETVFICAQYWPSKNIAEIAILDEGIGIKNTLKSNINYDELISNDKDAIVLALKPGVSQTYNSSKIINPHYGNSGYGLYMASEICAELKGSFYVISGNSAVLKNSEKKVSYYETYLEGTAICMRVNTNQIGEFEKIRDKVLVEGESQAKDIEKTIKKASEASKRLMGVK